MIEVIKGSEFKLLLKKRGITARYLSQELKVHETMISGYFTDRISIPAKFMIQAAVIAGLEMKDLVKGYKIDTSSESLASDTTIDYEKARTSPEYVIELIKQVQKEISQIREDYKIKKNHDHLEPA